MKKLLLGLGTLAAVVAPITTIVACGTTSDSGGKTEGPTTSNNGNQNPGIEGPTTSNNGNQNPVMEGSTKPDTENQNPEATLAQEKTSGIKEVNDSKISDDDKASAIAKINAATTSAELEKIMVELRVEFKKAEGTALTATEIFTLGEKLTKDGSTSTIEVESAFLVDNSVETAGNRTGTILLYFTSKNDGEGFVKDVESTVEIEFQEHHDPGMTLDGSEYDNEELAIFILEVAGISESEETTTE